jgi:type II secretory pathway pseudopilin PulG
VTTRRGVGVIGTLRRRLPASAPDNEQGLTLVEVTVALVVLMILSSAVLGLLLTANKTTHDDKLRVAASNLAAREVEIVRQYFGSSSDAVKDVVDPSHLIVTNPDPLAGGTAGQPLVVDGVPFTVVRTVSVQVSGAGKSPCDGGDQVAHPSYSVTATVTWPNMGVTRPVVNQTILTPPKGVLKDDTTGYLGVKVTNAAARPTTGVVVTVSGPAGTFPATTDSSGCAVVPLSQPGSYTASLNNTTPPYVDFYGNPAPSLTGIDVQSGKLTVKAMTYDQAAGIGVTFSTSAGYSLPQTLPSITLANTGLQPTGTESITAASAFTQITGLWPFTSGYTLWATCPAADPGADGARIGPIVPTGGSTASATIPFTPVDVWVYDTAGEPVPSATVTASSSSCSSSPDSPLTLGTTDASGHLAVSLPYGTWTVSSGDGSTVPLTVASDPVTAEVDLQ